MLCVRSKTRKAKFFRNKYVVFNRTGVAGAVLQTALFQLINSVTRPFPPNPQNIITPKQVSGVFFFNQLVEGLLSMEPIPSSFM